MGGAIRDIWPSGHISRYVETKICESRIHILLGREKNSRNIIISAKRAMAGVIWSEVRETILEPRTCFSSVWSGRRTSWGNRITHSSTRQCDRWPNENMLGRRRTFQRAGRSHLNITPSQHTGMNPPCDVTVWRLVAETVLKETRQFDSTDQRSVFVSVSLRDLALRASKSSRGLSRFWRWHLVAPPDASHHRHDGATSRRR
jgi:hypothetical protein